MMTGESKIKGAKGVQTHGAVTLPPLKVKKKKEVNSVNA